MCFDIQLDADLRDRNITGRLNGLPVHILQIASDGQVFGEVLGGSGEITSGPLEDLSLDDPHAFLSEDRRRTLAELGVT